MPAYRKAVENRWGSEHSGKHPIRFPQSSQPPAIHISLRSQPGRTYETGDQFWIRKAERQNIQTEGRHREHYFVNISSLTKQKVPWPPLPCKDSEKERSLMQKAGPPMLWSWTFKTFSPRHFREKICAVDKPSSLWFFVVRVELRIPARR